MMEKNRIILSFNLDAKSAPTRPKRPPRPNQPKAAALKPASAPTEHEKEGGV